MNKKQIVVTVASVVILGYLYMQPVKGIVKPQEAGASASSAPARRPSVNITAASVSAIAKPQLETGAAQQITALENKFNTAADADKPALQKQLAAAWDDVNQPAPAAFYYQELAHKSNQLADWLNAGKRFNTAYKLSQDTAAQGAFVANAAEAFEHAIKLQPANLEAKTGLGVAYVNGAGMPMQGITLLLDVVKQDPKNWDANMNLGMFSMKSRQFEKAVQRFKTLVAIREEVEPYFYLAESYKQLGQKQEAIAAYEKCKQLMGDPTAGQRIDEYIKELKK